MNFTRGAVYVNNYNVAYGQGLKNLITAAVNNIPGLSIQTVTTDSTSTYEVTLNYKGLLFMVRNRNYNFYIKVGSNEASGDFYPMYHKSVVAFMYSEEGVMSFSMTSLDMTHYNGAGIISIIPVEFKLSDGTTKELFWFKSTHSYDDKIGNIPQFAGRGSISQNLLIDPDSQIQYSFSIAGADAVPVTEAKGKSVAVPATFSNSYGEVVSYNIKGSSPMYFIYPGASDTLKNYYPGTQVIYIGNVAYIGIGYDLFIRT